LKIGEGRKDVGIDDDVDGTLLQRKGTHDGSGSDQKTATVLKGTGGQWWRGKHFILHYCEEEDHAQLLEELSKYRWKEGLVSGAFSLPL
jgi:hypothetical protein